MGREYGFDRHNYALIDHQGVLSYRSAGFLTRRLDVEAIRSAVETALVALPDDQPGAISPDFDGRVGLNDFFMFADAFGGTDPLFDLDLNGRVEFEDFFIFSDHFGEVAQSE